MDDETQGAETTNLLPAPTDDAGERPSDRALVERWLQRIQKAQKHHDKAFRRMRECMYMATHGGEKEWVESDRYTVPLISRHINLAVAGLYAKDPTTIVKRRKRRMYQLWDGTAESLEMAALAAQQETMAAEQEMAAAASMGAQPAMDPMGGQMGGAATAYHAALIQDIAAVKEYNRMIDGMAETLQILWEYQVNEQVNSFKTQVKALVRRAKTCGVGYVKIGFQREYEPIAERDDALADQTPVVAMVQRMQGDAQDPEKMEPDSAKAAEFEYAAAAMQEKGPLAREGIYFSFPKATRIVIDPACTNLKTFAGAKWIALEMFLTPDEIKETYGVDVSQAMRDIAEATGETSDQTKEEGALRVYEVLDKRTQTCAVVCEGHPGFLKAPAAPYVFVEGFWTIFPLVFNEIEDEDELFPPSDVWRARHMQNEYNRSRESLRQHRIAARPYYVVGRPVEDEDIKKLGNHADHEIIHVAGLGDGQSVDELIQRGPTAPIDPNLYEVENVNTDILRTVGAQEANLGGLSGGTATESSIAESSRMSGVSDNVDDLDDLLERLARAGGQILLMEMSKESVVKIVGDGAVWPDAPETRQSVAEELFLTYEAGSSGRPNKAQEIANIERAAPTLIQLPGLNHKPLIDKYMRLLELDPEAAYTAGIPSIVAQNAMMKPPAAGPMGAPAAPQGDVPAAQGAAGGGGPQPAEPTGPQPAYPQRGAGLENLS